MLLDQLITCLVSISWNLLLRFTNPLVMFLSAEVISFLTCVTIAAFSSSAIACDPVTCAMMFIGGPSTVLASVSIVTVMSAAGLDGPRVMKRKHIGRSLVGDGVAN